MLFKRMLRAALFDQSLYPEVAADPVAPVQAAVVVLLASLAAVAATIAAVAGDSEISLGEAILRGVVVMPGVWLIQAGSAFLLGRVTADAGAQNQGSRALLAAIGYSAAPGVLLALLAIEPMRDVAGALVPLWLFLSMAIAVKASLNVSFMRGIMSVVPGLVVAMLIGLIVSMVNEPAAQG